MSHEMMQILGIAGSLRNGSYNKLLLRAAQELAPDGMSIEPFDLAPVPFFNTDVEADGDPAPVTQLKVAIRSADALLIATPEYQHGIPGVLKNALEWAARPPGSSVLDGKVVAMMGASPSPVGTARAHLDLRRTLMYNQCRLVVRPEVLVANAPAKFENGRFTDTDGRKFLGQLLEKIADVVQSTHDSAHSDA